MLRRSASLLVSLTATSVPSNFSNAIDMAFYFPRFQPHSHVETMGIPEVKDAMALLQTSKADARWSTSGMRLGEVEESISERADRLKQRDKGLILLERGIDILEGIAGGAANPVVSGTLRSLYATRFELLNGSEHLPRCEYAKHMHVHKTILKQSTRLLYFDSAWDKTDLKQLDTTCVILGHFVKAFCALNTRPFNEPPAAPSISKASAKQKSTSTKTSASKALPKDWSLRVGDAPEDVLTLPMVMDRIEECLKLAKAAHAQHNGSSSSQVQWLEPKLLLLKALVTIPINGNLSFAAQHISQASKMVQAMTVPQNSSVAALTGHKLEPEVGLFMLAQAELSARMFDWDIELGHVDADVVRAFDSAVKFYGSQLESSTAAAHEQYFESQAYMVCLNSYANFLLNAPRPRATSPRDAPVFLPKQLFSTNPLTTVASSSHMIFSDVQESAVLTLENCRKRTGHALEKSLQLNRQVFSDYKENPCAVWTLSSMACMYADTRDYLYATGLFESAHKGFVTNYGANSMEMVLLQKLRYEFLAGVGSEQEAKTASHEVIQLLKHMDSLPS